MTDYDKAAQILIKRCQAALDKCTLDSRFWLSVGSNLAIKERDSERMWTLLITAKDTKDGSDHQIWLPDCKKEEQKYWKIPLSSRVAVNALLSKCRGKDVFFGWIRRKKVLDKSESLESLLVEYDLSVQNCQKTLSIASLI